MRRLTALALAVLIALSLPAWQAAVGHRQSPTAASKGGMAASDRSSDAAFVAPPVTVVKVLGAAPAPLPGPAAARPARLVDARVRSGPSRQFRSFPLLI